MVDFVEVLAFGVVGFLAGALSLFTLLYHLKKEEVVESMIENAVDNIANDEAMQTNLYKIGGLIGQGFKGGFGVDIPSKNRGGKFKIQDLVMQIIGEKILNTQNNPPPSPSTPPLPTPYNVNTKKDKFFNT